MDGPQCDGFSAQAQVVGRHQASMHKRRKETRLPNREDAALGARLALTNGKSHLTCADQLAEAGYVGSACSHLTLALEEVQKAYVLSLLHTGLSAADLGLRRVMTHHLTRHQFALVDTVFLAQFEIMLSREEELRTAAEDPEEQSRLDARSAVMDSIVADVRHIVESQPDDHPIAATIEWLRAAHDRKSHGFYVDFVDGEWRAPASLSLQIFERGRNVTKHFLDLKASHIEWALTSTQEEQAALRAHCMEAKVAILDELQS